MSRSVSGREVRLHDQHELDWTLPCERVHSAIYIVCSVKCRAVTVKKKRVETFRYGDGRSYIYIIQTAQQLWVPRWGSLRLAPNNSTSTSTQVV